MSAKIYGYAERREDVEAFQDYADVDIILEDMAERGQYRILRRFLRDGDTLLVARLSALGDSAKGICEEVGYLLQQHIRLRILDLPITLQELDESSLSLVYRTLSEVLLSYQRRKDFLQEQRSARQQAGIQAARRAGRQFGRPAVAYPQDWSHVFSQWQAREISAMDASRKLKLSRSTFYRMVKRYQQM